MSEMVEDYELIIMTEGQIMFYDSSKTSLVDKTAYTDHLLTSSYISAILKLTENASKGAMLTDLDMGKRNIQIKHGNIPGLDLKYLFITNKKEYKKRKAKKNFDKCIEEFESSYNPSILKSWSGDCNQFDEFKKKSKKILKL